MAPECKEGKAQQGWMERALPKQEPSLEFDVEVKLA
jgi:hypothetical protein